MYNDTLNTFTSVVKSKSNRIRPILASESDPTVRAEIISRDHF